MATRRSGDRTSGDLLFYELESLSCRMFLGNEVSIARYIAMASAARTRFINAWMLGEVTQFLLHHRLGLKLFSNFYKQQVILTEASRKNYRTVVLSKVPTGEIPEALMPLQRCELAEVEVRDRD